MAFNLESISTDAVHKPPMMLVVAKEKSGKALDVRTPILTADGWKTMADLKVGDVVYDKDGKRTNVTNVTGVQLNRPCNIVRFQSGSELIADDEHQWYTHSIQGNKVEILNTKKIASSIQPPKKDRYTHSVPVCGPVEIEHALNHTVDPYVLGFWLGDGVSSNGYVTIYDRDSEIRNHLGKLGKSHRSGEHCEMVTVLGLKVKLADMNVLDNKHIPDEYIWRSSVEDRMSLLAGLMDSDGFASNDGKRNCEFTSTNKDLAFGFVDLIHSLGCKGSVSVGRAMLNGKDCGEKYRINFQPRFNPFRWSRFKSDRYNNGTTKPKMAKNAIVSVERVDSVPVKCIEVDSPSHTYLAGRDLIVTHNSSFIAGDRVENGRIVEWGINKPIVLWLKGEEGVSHIPVAKNKEPISTFEDLMDALSWLAKEQHDFQTVAIDSLTTFCEIVKAKVQQDEPKLSSDHAYDQYGAGNKIASGYHRRICDALTWLRDNKSMTVLVTAHIKHSPKTVADPEKGTYDSWMADIPDAVWSIYSRSFDVIGYADTADVTQQADIGMGNKQGRIVSLNNGERFLYFKKTLAHPSGGRGIYGHLPEKIPFDWASFQNAIAETVAGMNNNNANKEN